MAAYYNEFDKQAAQWLRTLIAAGLIAPGDVDDRSIADVSPDDLRGYTQCHFFAGIGVWSFALRRAGWPDDRPVWTGSCPCQPFSQAGEGEGFDDERHLWPSFAWLIAERQPPVVFGEQVASKIVDAWVDLVHADLEAVGYAFGAVPFPSAGVGAPHIRDRLYWVGERLAHAGSHGLQGRVSGRSYSQRQAEHGSLGRGGPAGGMANATGFRLHGWRASEACDGANPPRLEPERLCDVGGLAHTSSERRQQVAGGSPGDEEAHGRAGRDRSQPDSDNLVAGAGEVCGAGHPGPVNGLWSGADWILCRDGKFRPVEPGTFPLVDGAASRVVRLRAYGNAINAEAATVFVEAFLEGERDRLAVPDLTDLDELI